MKNSNIYFLLFALGFAFSSCEKVIELDLEESESRIVIEANLPQGDSGIQILITKSVNYYNTNAPTAIEDALVILFDDAGNSYEIPHVQSGLYHLPLSAVAGRTYTLEVIAEGQTYQAESYMPEQVELLNIESEFQPATGPIEEGHIVYFKYQDPTEEGNYYRILHYIDDIPQLEGDDLQILNDGRNNGIEPRFPIFGHTFQEGEKITVELIHIDRAVHDYFNSLSDIISDGGPGGGTAAPGNPTTNWSNNALGYFSAYSSNSLSLIIE